MMMYAHVFMSRQKPGAGYFSQSLSTLIFETEALTEPEAH